MSEPEGQDRSARIELSRPAGARLELKKTVDGGVIRQSFSHGRSKAVMVEVKQQRPRPAGPTIARATPPAAPAKAAAPAAAPAAPPAAPAKAASPAAPVARAPAPPAAPAAAPVTARPPTPPPPVVPVAPEPPPVPVVPPPAAPPPVVEAEAPVVVAPPPVVEAPPPPPAPPQPTPIAKAPAGAAPAARAAAAPSPRAPAAAPPPTARVVTPAAPSRPSGRGRVALKPLTEEEKAGRLRALGEARKVEEEARKRAEENARRAAEEAERRRLEEEAAARRKAEEEARKRAEEEARRKAAEQARKLEEEEQRRGAGEAERAAAPAEDARRGVLALRPGLRPVGEEEDRGGRGKVARRPGAGRPGDRTRDVKKPARLLLDEDERQRIPSLAALRRHRERERRQAMGQTEVGHAAREVVIPETITVQELAARMAVRGADVIKVLMRNGIMSTVTQTIDADTAELVVAEFGHKVKRVSEADVELGIEGDADRPEDLVPRSPVVTVMGHVDHGKTSLLDALRQTNVAAGEAGGITQHIGAYRVDIGTGRPVTFIDTPGHAAFTQMRARGASVTDIVVLVVAADDGVMPQTVEAIRHAKAANAPIVVAINKIDKPEADPERVKNELLSHEVVVEDFGGDVLAVPVSAVKRTGLDKLIEAIQLQAELLDLKANPNRAAQGTIIEAKLERGRGAVATVLVQRGTLKVGDTVVCGAAWGRVRALIDDRGQTIESAGPSTPVEILGLDGVPEAGDVLQVVEDEKRAREISEYRQRKKREQELVAAVGGRSSLEDMFSALKSGETKELAVVVKSDVHGSLEAITAGLEKLRTEEVGVRVLHGGVGAITESDVTLAAASKGFIIGFNVRANAQARELAKREGVDIRYYSIIYELLDDAKQMLSGMLAPEAREIILGHAEIREVFAITKVGKVAGCRVVDGIIKRTAKARLLRDNVVIHEGALASLKRFKDDVREVKEGFECGMSLENYDDIKVGDVIEAYEVQEVTRTL